MCCTSLGQKAFIVDSCALSFVLNTKNHRKSQNMHKKANCWPQGQEKSLPKTKALCSWRRPSTWFNIINKIFPFNTTLAIGSLIFNIHICNALITFFCLCPIKFLQSLTKILRLNTNLYDHTYGPGNQTHETFHAPEHSLLMEYLKS